MDMYTELILFYVIILEITIVAIGLMLRLQTIEQKINNIPQITEKETK